MIILSTNRLNNLIAMIIGIITSQSVVLSKTSQGLKDCYSLGTEEIKINLYNIGIIKIKFLIYSLLRSFRFMHM